MSDEEVREAVEKLRRFVGRYDCPDSDVEEAADLIERLAAERDDAWRICATWRERAHAAEAENKMLEQLAANNAVALQEAWKERDELAAALRKS